MFAKIKIRFHFFLNISIHFRGKTRVRIMCSFIKYFNPLWHHKICKETIKKLSTFFFLLFQMGLGYSVISVFADSLLHFLQPRCHNHLYNLYSQCVHLTNYFFNNLLLHGNNLLHGTLKLC